MFLFEINLVYILHLMHTIKQIIENQAEFKQEIIDFLKKDIQDSLDVLKSISTEDSEVNEQLVELKRKIHKMKTPSIPSLFFSHKNKEGMDYYAWWDIDNEEAIIYKYVKTE